MGRTGKRGSSGIGNGRIEDRGGIRGERVEDPGEGPGDELVVLAVGPYRQRIGKGREEWRGQNCEYDAIADENRSFSSQRHAFPLSGSFSPPIDTPTRGCKVVCYHDPHPGLNPGRSDARDRFAGRQRDRMVTPLIPGEP